MKSHSAELLRYLQSHLPIDRFVVQAIVRDDNHILGYHCALVLVGGDVVASGTHQTLGMARQIAIAEALERIAVKNLNAKDLALIKFSDVPSTSGFAAGFDDTHTQIRALCEGVERWGWSQWIDRGHRIVQKDFEQIQLSPLADQLSKSFDKIKFFGHRFRISSFSLDFGVVLAQKGRGLFAGSRVSLAGQDVWTHSLIEAHRNFTNFNLSKDQILKENDWFMRRVLYFGHNGNEALSAVERAQESSWPDLQFDVFRKIPISHNLFSLWRCLIKDFTPWHQGPDNRFVY